MSFYYNDDDESDNGGDVFSCPNCGGTESYKDDAGNMFCGVCFSQSQTQLNEAEFDHEEMNAHIARGRRGQVLGLGYNKKERKRKRKPLAEYDQSRPLPSLEECLTGYTAVIQACLKSVSALLKLSKEHTDVVENSVRLTWISYLKSWQEGAEFYNQLHPDVRISMRDAFITTHQHRRMISRFLMNQAAEKVKKEETLDGDSDGDSDDESEEAIQPKQHGTRSAPATLSAMLTMYQRKSPKDAALRVYPNMQTIAALLLTTLCKLGVSAHHVTRWIANGEIPLLNAYKECLTPSLQYKLEMIQQTFRIARIPYNYVIEYKAKLLMVATGHEPQLVPPAAVPLLTTRLVTDDLHLGPQVLNIALALLGESPHSKETWLPGAVALERFKRIDQKELVLAAIVVACRLCPGWELRNYTAPSGSLIPWSNGEVERMASLETYRHFVETQILDGRTTKNKVPDFMMGEQKSEEPPVDDKSTPSIVLAGETNPNQPSMQRIQKHHEWNLRLKKRRATWADANGFESYVVYENLHTKCHYTHPHYQVLLEFMAHTTDVSALTIHRHVMKLDLEIKQRYETNLHTSLKRMHEAREGGGKKGKMSSVEESAPAKEDMTREDPSKRKTYSPPEDSGRKRDSGDARSAPAETESVSADEEIDELDSSQPLF